MRIIYPNKSQAKQIQQKAEKKNSNNNNIETPKPKIKSHLKIMPNLNTKTIPSTYTPATLGNYYSMPKPGTTTINGQSFTISDVGVKIGIVSLGGSYVLRDLRSYWTNLSYYYNGPRQFNSNGTPVNVNFISVNGANNRATSSISSSDGASIENMLDIEIIGAMCPNAIINVYFAPNTNQGFINAITQACANNNVVSISWGLSEIASDSSTLTAIQNVFAAYPRTIVCVASGDNGNNDGIGYFFPAADFPSSSPNVVACGGSSLANRTSEIAWSWNSLYGYGGGGAPSLYFNKNTNQNAPNFTYGTGAFDRELNYLFTNNRTTPDIAFNADPSSGWVILVNGRQMSVGGTSAVSPFMAGYFGLIYSSISNITTKLSSSVPFTNYLYDVYNNAKNTSGFINPFNDITAGSNNNTWNSNYFNAISGYDLCTGLGSFNGSNLLYYLSLQ